MPGSIKILQNQLVKTLNSKSIKIHDDSHKSLLSSEISKSHGVDLFIIQTESTSDEIDNKIDRKNNPDIEIDNSLQIIKTDSVCCECKFYEYTYRKWILVVACATFISGCLVIALIFILGSPFSCQNNFLGSEYNSPLSALQATTTTAAPTNQTYNIVLFGDSLINHPYMSNNLGGKMSEYLPQYTLNIENYGVDANTIALMRDRLYSMIDATRYTDCIFVRIL